LLEQLPLRALQVHVINNINTHTTTMLLIKNNSQPLHLFFTSKKPQITSI